MEILGIILCIVILASPFLAIGLFKRKIKLFETELMSFKESIDLTNLPIVTFEIDGKKCNFLLDTGASGSVINKGVLDQFKHVEIDAISTVFGMEGNPQEVPVVEMWLNYRSKTFKEVFQAIDMNNAFSMIKQEYGVTIHGILGSNFFKKYKYILNFDNLVAYTV